MTAFLMFILLVLTLVAWGMSHSSQRRLIEATRGERNEWRDIALDYQESGRKLERALVVTRATLALAEIDRNMHATALRGELHRQARAELLKPDEPIGVGQVLKFTTTGRGGRRVGHV